MMTEDQKNEIAILTEDYHTKKIIFDGKSMMNTAGLTPSESLKQSISYRISMAEMMEAFSRLESATLAIAAAARG